MSIRAVVFSSCVLAISLAARSAATPRVISSQAVDGLFVSILYDRAPLPDDKPIRYWFSSVANPGPLVYLPKDEYLYCAQLLDPNGVRSTVTNGPLGKRFFDLNYPWDERDWKKVQPYLKIRPPHGTRPSTAAITIATTNGSDSFLIPAPTNLFEIKAAGTNELGLQFQVFKQLNQGGTNDVWRLVRFPEIKVRIVTKARTR